MGLSIIITGASGDLGSALAKAYSQPSVTLGLLGRNKKNLQALQQQCQHKGARVEYASIDVTNDQQLQQWITVFDQKHSVDLLIANAGVTSSVGPNGEAEDWDAISRVIDTNLKGVLSAIQPLILPMRSRKKDKLLLLAR